MTRSVPLLTSLNLLSGIIAHEPIKLLFWSSTKQVQGNSAGLACPCFLLLISLNLLSPHLFSPRRMFRGSGSEHLWSQLTTGFLLLGLVLWIQRDCLVTSFNVFLES